MSVTAPRGFTASGVTAGLKASGQTDLGLLVADRPAAVAGLFTTNAFPAAPVALSREVAARGRALGVVVNSGQANAGAGETGMADARQEVALAAAAIGVQVEDMLVCSTGVIGPRIDMDRLGAGLPRAAASLSKEGGPEFARAILTTDAGPKETVVERGGIVVGGCAKGAGMVAPDLATMLAFLATDVDVAPDVLDEVVRRTVAPAFNGLIVDGCTSTNDTVLVMAGGASRITAEPGAPALAALEDALAAASHDLVRLLALGAEGAAHALAVQVSGAATDEEARAVGRTVAGSLLVKTAVFGGDPNVGRLLQAVGAAGAAFDPGAVAIDLGGQTVVSRGSVATFDEDACRDALKEREILIRVDLGDGPGSATCFGCDLGYEYVRLNAEYTT